MAKLLIEEIATQKGIKQSHLQLEARVTPPLLQRYWHNKTSTIDLDELEKIANALGVHPGDLIATDQEYAAMPKQEKKQTGNKRGRKPKVA